ncbi:hypothetical protein RRF57_001469 [Xylaria bambusicola]|uniref:Uncharacterized protein n=1 Tax=Xylaria bambusicola TaxID=326684 RepID=A0AAN7UBX8_9PEZI
MIDLYDLGEQGWWAHLEGAWLGAILFHDDFKLLGTKARHGQARSRRCRVSDNRNTAQGRFSAEFRYIDLVHEHVQDETKQQRFQTLRRSQSTDTAAQSDQSMNSLKMTSPAR